MARHCHSQTINKHTPDPIKIFCVKVFVKRGLVKQFLNIFGVHVLLEALDPGGMIKDITTTTSKTPLYVQYDQPSTAAGSTDQQVRIWATKEGKKGSHLGNKMWGWIFLCVCVSVCESGACVFGVFVRRPGVSARSSSTTAGQCAEGALLS
eukprot:2781620-Amphidinium_carterae.1